MSHKAISRKNEDFFSQVYEVVKLIPAGRVTSYGAIGKYLGQARSARMVGWAMNNSHQVEGGVPAHRVVNRNGVLTGKHHFADEGMMENLLRKEGVEVENDQIVNFKQVYWDPMIELSL